MTFAENGFLTAERLVSAGQEIQTPFYLYDEKVLQQKCIDVKSMPNAYGLKVSYAMKANANKALLQYITSQGFDIDASSLNEARRAHMAGVKLSQIMLTTQEVPVGDDRADMEKMILAGMTYNVCSLRQLELIADFALSNNIKLAMRVHPGIGTGETVTRNTGDKYSCFGVHSTDLEKALEFASEKGLVFNQVHTHIGSGGDPEVWKQNIDIELEITEKYFPDATIVNFGGGFKEARMPEESAADIQKLGEYAKEKFTEFFEKTGRKLTMKIEPGTYLVANAGYLVTKVLDIKQTGADGFEFLVLDGGMESSSRPLLYGSKQPFYIISKNGEWLSSEFDKSLETNDERVLVGRCCESGDSQCLDVTGQIIPRKMAKPDVDDFVVIGGTGAYCAGMSLVNYNSYFQAPEVLLREDKTLVIRKLESLEQMTQNEIDLL